MPSVFNFPLKSSEGICTTTKGAKKEDALRNRSPKRTATTATFSKRTKSPLERAIKVRDCSVKKGGQNIETKGKEKVTKIGSLSNLIDDLKEKALIDESRVTVLKNKFLGTTLELIKNQLLNQEKDPKGRRYEEEVKKFALTLNFYSPRAYDYIRTVFSLPHARSLSKWTSSVECQPGIFSDALSSIGESIITNPDHADCALLCDAMSIKSSVFYSRSSGEYEGFVNYGDGMGN